MKLVATVGVIKKVYECVRRLISLYEGNSKREANIGIILLCDWQHCGNLVTLQLKVRQ
jgi:hypothetical protein